MKQNMLNNDTKEPHDVKTQSSTKLETSNKFGLCGVITSIKACIYNSLPLLDLNGLVAMSTLIIDISFF